ncbi:hypothetical protein CDL12_28696 [Handroanthus impetiginosus]|uniref:Uncharacterized protein n=1 Tax=Handroanthus impetiginosus TaxID=429701 RepID=A0A2G9G1P2_9LAMI|nr:hypothetical protein CDL12_28696 [Handroanthus impetiginosus]
MSDITAEHPAYSQGPSRARETGKPRGQVITYKMQCNMHRLHW